MNTRTEGRSVIYVGGFPVGTVCSTDVMMVPTDHHWSLGKKRKIRMQGCRETEQTNSNYCISTYTANTLNCNYNPFLSDFTYFKFLASHCFIECGSYFFSAVLIRIEYSCLRSNHLFKNYVTSKLLKIEWAVKSKLGDIVSILFILPKQFIRLSLYRTRSTSWAKY